jgi:hypothetical protein
VPQQQCQKNGDVTRGGDRASEMEVAQTHMYVCRKSK